MQAARRSFCALTQAVLAATLAHPAAAGSSAQGGAAPAVLPVPPAVFPVPPAQDKAAHLNEQGLALYAAQDYRHALERFIGALALEDDPNVLFNIGRCYEQLGELDAALEKYRQFVAAPESDAAGVARARASITNLAAARQARLRAAASESFPLMRAFPAFPARAEPDPLEPSGPPWLLVGGAVAFAAVGTTVYALGVRDHAQITSLPEYGKGSGPAEMTWRRANQLSHSGNTKKVTGGVLLGVAGGLAVTTIAWLLWQDREPELEPAFAIAPSALGGGGGLLLAGSFR